MASAHEPDVRAAILCEIREPEPVVAGRLTCEAGSRSYGYFWLDRPYMPYHWLVGGETMCHYINLGRVQSLSEDRIVWDDYAVDVLAWPDAQVEVVDEHEVPPDADESILTFIADSTTRVLAERRTALETADVLMYKQVSLSSKGGTLRKLLVLTLLIGLFGVAGVALADPNLTLQAPPHRHFINGVEVGPRYCDNLDSSAIKAAFTQFHANTHTHNGVTGEIGPVAPGLHNGVGGELTFGPC